MLPVQLVCLVLLVPLGQAHMSAGACLVPLGQAHVLAGVCLITPLPTHAMYTVSGQSATHGAL